MLLDAEIQQLFLSLQLAPEAIAFVQRVRSNPPQRRVEAGKRNVPVRFSSARMERVIQGESSTVEGYFAQQCEFDQDNVLEFWDQPESVPLLTHDKNGKPRRDGYTADYLVITKHSVFVVECKSLEELPQLISNKPHDWVKKNDQYVYLPAKQYFDQIGLEHVVWHPSERDCVRMSNIALLLDHRENCDANIDDRTWKKVQKHLTAVGACSISQLLDVLHTVDTTQIFELVLDRRIYCDINTYLLSRADDALLALDEPSLLLVQEGMKALRVTPSSTTDVSASRLPIGRRAAEFALRLKQIDGSAPLKVTPRTIRRYRKTLREFGGDLRSLVPQTHLRGNRKKRLSRDHKIFIKACISADYKTPIAESVDSCYSKYLTRLEKERAINPAIANDKPVSRSTYANLISREVAEGSAGARGGKRAANAAAEPVRVEHGAIFGTRPFESGHIDHCLMKQFAIVCRDSKRIYAARPWLTVMRDDCSKSALAMALSFASPSRNSCSKVIRDCARRHGRIPRKLTQDGGAEFGSIFYESSLAMLGCHKAQRPPYAPRFGGQLERLFGTTKTRLSWRLPGSTRNDGKGRAAAPAFRGCNQAESPLIEIYQDTETFFFDQLNTHKGPEMLMSPDQAVREGLAMFPFSGCLVSYDSEFMVLTSIDAPRETYLVDLIRGIRPFSRWHWHPELALLANGSRVKVRLDPWDDDLVYAEANGKWLCCRSRATSPFAERDLISMICESTRRLEGRQALQEAKVSADTDLARWLLERQKESTAAKSGADTGDKMSEESEFDLHVNVEVDGDLPVIPIDVYGGGDEGY